VMCSVKKWVADCQSVEGSVDELISLPCHFFGLSRVWSNNPLHVNFRSGKT
jgi:hypothetical protein